MSTCPCNVRGPHSSQQHELVDRQIQAWLANDFTHALGDWESDGVLTAPRGVRVGAENVPGVVDGWHKTFSDLSIELTSLFASPDDRWLCIEWTWTVTRTSTAATSVTDDSIVVELRDGRVTWWREYFDTFGSVEFEE